MFICAVLNFNTTNGLFQLNRPQRGMVFFG